jgi:hypothetical protein
VLRCGRCKARIDKVKSMQFGGWILDNGLDSAGPNYSRWADPFDFASGTNIYLCKCGTPHQIALRELYAAAPKAYELRKDLLAGEPGYGLPA